MPLDILNKFTNHLKNAIGRAINLAWKYKHTYVMPLHLYLGLLEEKGSLASEIISKLQIPTNVWKQYLSALPINQPTPYSQLSPQTMQIMEKAALIAYNYQHVYIGTEHLLLALLQNPDDYLKNIWLKHKINCDNLINQTINILKNDSRFLDMTSFFNGNEQAVNDLISSKPTSSALDFFCTNLTNEKIQNKIDPVIGRGQEIDRLIHILSRRTKNNPILVGEAGVGKTAIIEGLAKKIIEKSVPDVLQNKKIYRLDLGLVVAGTMYRGEFEARFKQIIEELEKNENIILFIDEIHTLIGAGGGGAGNAMDAANILKPALAKGNVRCIGATTLQEYQKYIESDAALERRFQSILVEEPNTEETIAIIQGVKKNYERYHHVKINDEAITTAVMLSNRYLQDKFQPDKAIDLIDEAAAKTKINLPPDAKQQEVESYQEKLSVINRQKIQLVRQEKFEEALALKQTEKQLIQKLNLLKLKLEQEPTKFSGEITKKDIAEIISYITGVPVTELLTTEKNQLLNLNNILNKQIIGQEEVTKIIADFIRRSRAGLTAPNRPTGSFVFLGPSGVGKTELAKALAKILFGDTKALIRLDMSEFSEKFNISKLIGAPAGYVGYKEGTKFTDLVKRKPYSVILFDEIEKAHPDVFNLLLQILDEGHLTDATGKKINFKNTIVILTSNIGLKEFEQQAKIGFTETNSKDKIKYEEIKEHVLKQLKKHFLPEFLNRIDRIIVFKPLGLASLIKIVNLEMDRLAERLQEKRITLKLAKPVLKFIAEKSFSPDQGARAIRKNIQDLIESNLAEKILTDEIKEGQTIRISLKNGQLTFSK